MRPRARAEAIARGAGSVAAAVRALKAAGFTEPESMKAIRAAFGLSADDARDAVRSGGEGWGGDDPLDSMLNDAFRDD